MLYYQINDAGCAPFIVDTSVFFNTRLDDHLRDLFDVTVNVTEKGTGELLVNLNQQCMFEGRGLVCSVCPRLFFPRCSDVKICNCVNYV